jgi:hypothetical protein
MGATRYSRPLTLLAAATLTLGVTATTGAAARAGAGPARAGGVLGEIIARSALPPGMRAHRGMLLRLGRVFSQLEAPVGAFGLDTLRASTRALASNSPGDATYTRIENALQRLGTARDTVGKQMRALLIAAAFGGRPLDVPAAQALIRRGDRLLGQAAVLGAKSA